VSINSQIIDSKSAANNPQQGPMHDNEEFHTQKTANFGNSLADGGVFTCAKASEQASKDVRVRVLSTYIACVGKRSARIEHMASSAARSAIVTGPAQNPKYISYSSLC
jgi:hypothetical protein